MAEVINLEKLISKLNKLSDQQMEQALNKACILVENQAKENCPVDTGELRMSITHYVEGDTGVVGTNKQYAPYVEYGTGLFARDGNGRQTPWSYQDAKGEWHTTKGQKPQPFLEPALLDNEKNIIKIFDEAIKEGVK